MDWFSKWRKKSTTLERTIRPTDQPERFGDSYFYPIINTNDDYLSYLNIPELAVILYQRAKMMASGKIDAVSKKTGEPAKANESLVRVLRNPNYFQAYTEFWRQSSIFRDVYGKQFLYFLTPVGFPNSYKGLYNLNPARVEIKILDKSQDYFTLETMDNVEFIYTNEQGRQQVLDKSRLIYLNDPQANPTNFMDVKSKIEILKPALDNIALSYSKRGVMHQLAPGIFSKGQSDATGISVELPQDSEERKRTERRFRNKDQYPFITSNILNYDAMNVNPSQMGLFEEVQADTTKICDMYGIPYNLLSNYKNSALGSKGVEKQEDKKQVYEDVIIPDFQEVVDAINNFIGEKSWQVKADWSHLTVFSVNQKQRAETLSSLSQSLINLLNAGLISEEQAKEELKKLNI